MSKMNRRQLFLSSAKGALAAALGAVGLRTAQAQSPTATVFPDSKVLPTPTPPFEGFIQPNLIDSQPGWPPAVMPPEGAANVLLILIDDAGFGSNSAFGGIVPTPTLDKLANAGLRYTQMHNTALCSPTRAALLTGRNHHRVGYGMVAEGATGYPGYNSIIGPETAHGARALRRTATRPPGSARTTTCRPGRRARRGRSTSGRSARVTIISTASSAAIRASGSRATSSATRRRSTPMRASRAGTSTRSSPTEAIQYIEMQTSTDPKRPWFIHYAPGATHAPHHPTPEWIEKIEAMHLFDGGWNAVAEKIFENQKKLGVVPANAKLPPWPDFLPKWETLTADEKKLYLRQINVWAAYMAYTDYEIGRIIETLEKLGLFDNTLIIWVCGDNGMSAEGSMHGTPNEVAYFNGFAFTVEQQLPFIPIWGTDKTYPHFAVPWAFAMDTPYKWTKQVASHLGGTRTGMVVTWPKRIKDAGGIRHQFHHVIDVVPTIFEAIGIPQPTMVNGIAQVPWDGTSMVYSFDKAAADAPSTRKTQYFEILGNRAIYHDGWMASTYPRRLSLGGRRRPSAGRRPERLQVGALQPQGRSDPDERPSRGRARAAEGMQELWMIEAVRNNVLPLNASQIAILTVERPDPPRAASSSSTRRR